MGYDIGDPCLLICLCSSSPLDWTVDNMTFLKFVAHESMLGYMVIIKSGTCLYHFFIWK